MTFYFRDAMTANPEAVLNTTLSEKVIDTGIHFHPSLSKIERCITLPWHSDYRKLLLYMDSLSFVSLYSQLTVNNTSQICVYLPPEQ